MAVPKVLVLSRLYPNTIMPNSGIYVQRLVDALANLCEIRVVAPVPYCPPLGPHVAQTRFRDVPRRRVANAVEVTHPRFLTGPGYSFHSFEWHTFYWGIRSTIAGLRREFPFDLIHAHMSYPDGVAAAHLAKRYGVPAVITEHAPWLPWMNDYPRVRRAAVWASRQCAFHIGVSRYARDTIAYFTGESENLHVIPVGVDGATFESHTNQAWEPNLILFVGRIHRIKGIDILLHAMRRLIARRPQLRLRLVGGGSFFGDSRRQEDELRSLARDLDLGQHVEFAGEQSPAVVAALMRKSALLVLPSRAESFGAVLVEALSCGTPVVATRCGGPEDIVNEHVGVLVEKEDPDALARAIESVMDRRHEYDAALLRAHALENFSWNGIAWRTAALYTAALDSSRKPLR